MEVIEQTSRSFLLVCVLFLVMSLSFLGLRQYIKNEPLFIPPQDFENHAVNLLNEIDDLEATKKMCTIWAERYDLDNKLLDTTLDKFEELLNLVTKIIIYLSAIFGCGFGYIYWKVNGLRNER